MNTIPAQDIKRRGIAAVDAFLAQGDVHIIKNNKPQYVVLTEERYQALVSEANEAYLARVRNALDEVKQNKVRKFTSPDELLKALDEE
ncbi:MAG TPA: prevent-host-death protein [Deltaproteobacteria bacterium]|nr:prevent-host-death protein [Deltaproteobacteria bacterium]HQB39603.1 prevent-host-death protein [Deltaproteobacteria bacterium]